MNDRLRTWLMQELKARQLSQRELARQSGVSQTRISQTLSGDIPISADFCIKLAPVLGVSPEFFLRLAQILPPEPTTPDNATVEETIELLKNLTQEHQEEVLNYVKWLIAKASVK